MSDRERDEQPPPTETRPERGSQEQRADHRPDPAGDHPTRHVVLAPGRLQIHQRRLRQRHECARCRVEKSESEQQQPPRARRSRRGEPCRKTDTTGDDECTPPSADSRHADHRLDEQRHQARPGEHDADHGVREAEVVSNQRPSGLASPEDELVEQLDREQRRDDAERSSAGDLPGRVRAHRRTFYAADGS